MSEWEIIGAIIAITAIGFLLCSIISDIYTYYQLQKKLKKEVR